MVRADESGGGGGNEEGGEGRKERSRVFSFLSFPFFSPHLVIHEPGDDRRLPHGLVAQKDLRFFVFFREQARRAGGGEEKRERGRGRTRCAVFPSVASATPILLPSFFSLLSALRALPCSLVEREESFTLEDLSDASSTLPACTWRVPPSLSRFLFSPVDFVSNALSIDADAEYSKASRCLALSLCRWLASAPDSHAQR